MSLFKRIASEAKRSGGKSSAAALGVVLCSTALTCGVVWVLFAASNLYADAANTSEKAAALQAIAAGVSLTATLVLLGVTAWYAVLTRGILRQSGPVVAAEFRIGWLPPFGHGGGVITAPLSTLKTGTPDERYPVATWAISLRNSGNASTKVNRIAVQSESGFTVHGMETLAGPNPIFTLDGHTSETVCIELDLVLAGLDAWEGVKGSVSKRLRAEVTLGSGVTVLSPWGTLP